MALRTHARTRNPLSCPPAIRFPCLPRAHPQVIACLTSNCRFICVIYCVFLFRHLLATTPGPDIAALESSDDVVNRPCLPSAVNQCDWHEATHQAKLCVGVRNRVRE